MTIVDNLSRRNIDTELGCDSLTPITHPEVRLEAWKELTGKTIHFENLDVATEYDRLELLMKTVRPDSVVHFATVFWQSGRLSLLTLSTSIMENTISCCSHRTI